MVSYLVGLVLAGLSELLVDKPIIDKPTNMVFGADIVRDLKHHNVNQPVRLEFGDDIVKQSTRRTFIMIESAVDSKMPEAGASRPAPVAKRWTIAVPVLDGDGVM